MSRGSHRAVVIEADGGSRGNPGPSAYGAVLKDADTGEVIAEDGTTIGRATNNVAEYSGLIAGLRLAEEFAPDADIEVRMDSKLVVEQMSGRWKIKHPDMRPLAAEAARLAPFGTTYTWVPRERNKHADRLANEALDGVRNGVSTPGGGGREDAPDVDEPTAADSLVEEVEREPAPAAPARGWSADGGVTTTLVLLRHGVTAHTLAKRFSGGLASANPALSDEGREQARSAGEWLLPAAERIDAVVASPVRRTLETAEIVAELLGRPVATEPGLAEAEFGAWDGLTFAEVAEQQPDALDAWLGKVDVAPPGGESFREVEKRVLAALDRLLEEHAGRTVVAVSHVTPIKILVGHAVGAPLEAVFRMELSPASLSVLTFHTAPGQRPRSSMRLYNALPPGRDGFGSAATSW